MWPLFAMKNMSVFFSPWICNVIPKKWSGHTLTSLTMYSDPFVVLVRPFCNCWDLADFYVHVNWIIWVSGILCFVRQVTSFFLLNNQTILQLQPSSSLLCWSCHYPSFAYCTRCCQLSDYSLQPNKKLK